MMNTTINALSETNSDLPLKELLGTLYYIDNYKTNSKEHAVESIIETIVETNKNVGVSKTEILAEVMKQCLMSASEDPNHISALDLFTLCDNCMGEIEIGKA